MKNKIFFFIFIFISINVYSQSLKDLTASGIDFFLKSDKARYLSHDQKTGLSILENLLEQQSEREHEIDVAHAQSSQININGTNQEVKILPGSDGGLYLVTGNKVYPLESKLINTVKNYSSTNTNASTNKIRNNNEDNNSYRNEPFNEKIFEGKYEYRTTIIDNPVLGAKLRDKPNFDGSTIYMIKKGDVIYVIKKTNKYFSEVYVNGYRGYLSDYFLKRKW